MAGRHAAATLVAAIAALCVWLGLALLPAPVGPAAAQAATTTVTTPGSPVTGAPGATTSSSRPAGSTTTTVPCGVTTPVSLRFVGSVVSVSGDAVRFAVSEARAGELPNREVVVRYGADARYLREGTAYLVAAWPSGDRVGGLAGRVRAGDEEPICVEGRLTTLADGASIDTGVISPLVSGWRDLARAVALPAAAAVAVLFVLVLVKRAVVRVVRGPRLR